MKDLELQNTTVLVTRARHQAAAFAEPLRAHGAEVVLLPTLDIQPLSDLSALKAVLQGAVAFDWLVLTSVNGVQVLAQQAEQLGVSLPKRFAASQFAAVGSQTAQALQAQGLEVSLLPETQLAEALAEHLQAQIAGKSVLLLQALKARPLLQERLQALAQVTAIPLYDTLKPADTELGKVLDLLKAKQLDFLTFTSALGVSYFAEQLLAALQQTADALTLSELLQGAQIACIGPVTAEAARSALGRADLVAEPHSIAGLLQALIQARRTTALQGCGK